jgi:hypothetical protein
MAREPARSSTRTKTGKRQGRSRRRAAKTLLFHGPSFFTGIVVGIGATIVGALLPGWWEASAVRQPESGGATAEQVTPAEMQFEFWDELPRDRVTTNPDAYRRTTPNESIEYLVQAGSFEQLADADRLRASLLLLGLDASTRTVTLDGGATWHRVLVGPFDLERDTRRVMTRLREQRIDPLLLKRPLPKQAAHAG